MGFWMIINNCRLESLVGFYVLRLTTPIDYLNSLFNWYQLQPLIQCNKLKVPGVEGENQMRIEERAKEEVNEEMNVEAMARDAVTTAGTQVTGRLNNNQGYWDHAKKVDFTNMYRGRTRSI